MNALVLVVPALASLSLLLLAAHVLRNGFWGLAAALICGLALVAARLAWVQVVLAVTLGLGALLWTRSGIGLIHIRLLMDAPWIRLAVILGLVLVFILLALGLVLGEPGRRWFHRRTETALGGGTVFALVVGTLSLVSMLVPFPMLLAERYLPGSGPLEILALGIYAVTVWQAVLDPKNHRRLRPLIWGGFSLVFFLQFGLGLLGLDRMLMTGDIHLPIPALILAGPLYRGDGFFMLGLFLSTVLLVGPAWCSHLCYIGSWDLGCASQAKGSPRHLGPWHWIGRGLSLIMVMTIVWLLRTLGLPTTVAIAAALAFGLLGVGIMLFVSSRLGVMAHCNLWCPVGLAATTLGRISPWRLVMNEACTSCGLCIRSCRYSALDPARIRAGRPGLSCTLCGDCLAACPHDALELRIWNFPWPLARQAFLVLIIALHSIFLGLARI
ncbi:MAG: 4Fe-4S ferredoxin [Deltaproteobacteria bacterium]|nr:4Fe-4S ferredoxin [Deltaproteobacteria bacterium]